MFDNTESIIENRSADEWALILDTMGDNEELFDDMLFEQDSITGPFLEVEDVLNETEEELDPPEELYGFSYDDYDIRVSKLNGRIPAYFNQKDMSLTVDPDYIYDEPVVLHQMIHLHEAVLNRLSPVYHDDCLVALYKDLKNKIDDLDERIEENGNLLFEIFGHGDSHDTLFLLKSYDLDLKKGWEPGTVLGADRIPEEEEE